MALLLELPAAWLMIKLADFLLQAVTVRIIHERRSLGGPPQLVLENGVLFIAFIPASAVLSTLIYYRLTAVRAAAGLS